MVAGLGVLKKCTYLEFCQIRPPKIGNVHPKKVHRGAASPCKSCAVFVRKLSTHPWDLALKMAVTKGRAEQFQDHEEIVKGKLLLY